MSMVFCGNCGYRLSAGDQVCPQCGTPADPDLLPTQENPDQPTMASNSLYPPEDAPTQVKMQPPQEPLILAPQDAYEPDAPTRAVQRPSASQSASIQNILSQLSSGWLSRRCAAGSLSHHACWL